MTARLRMTAIDQSEESNVSVTSLHRDRFSTLEVLQDQRVIVSVELPTVIGFPALSTAALSTGVDFE
jgi:hypothetical protein